MVIALAEATEEATDHKHTHTANISTVSSQVQEVWFVHTDLNI